jgi:hypothetical protein
MRRKTSTFLWSTTFVEAEAKKEKEKVEAASCSSISKR